MTRPSRATATDAGGPPSAYRHGDHAGNFADVHKHAFVCAALHELSLQPGPLTYLESHAGTGLYDLGLPGTRHYAEWRDGIGRLWNDPSPAAFAVYLSGVRSHNADGALRNYPGSPALARGLLREGDRAVLIERQAAAARELRNRWRADRRISVHTGNGFRLLPDLLPPRGRRGLLLVDPPHASEEDGEATAELLERIVSRWPKGCLVAWYPLFGTPRDARFRQRVATCGVRRILDTRIVPGEPRGGMRGSGLLVIQPPRQLATRWPSLGRRLATALGGPSGVAHCAWLVPGRGV